MNSVDGTSTAGWEQDLLLVERVLARRSAHLVGEHGAVGNQAPASVRGVAASGVPAPLGPLYPGDCVEVRGEAVLEPVARAWLWQTVARAVRESRRRGDCIYWVDCVGVFGMEGLVRRGNMDSVDDQLRLDLERVQVADVHSVEELAQLLEALREPLLAREAAQREKRHDEQMPAATDANASHSHLHRCMVPWTEADSRALTSCIHGREQCATRRNADGSPTKALAPDKSTGAAVSLSAPTLLIIDGPAMLASAAGNHAAAPDARATGALHALLEDANAAVILHRIPTVSSESDGCATTIHTANAGRCAASQCRAHPPECSTPVFAWHRRPRTLCRVAKRGGGQRAAALPTHTDVRYCP
eukprot:ctg_653.g283